MMAKPVPFTLLLGAAGLALVACSSSASNGTNGNGNGDGNGSMGSICPKIPQADIQALLAQPITMVSEGDLTSQLFECDASGLQLQMQTDDGNLGLYNGISPDDPDRHAVSGVGDVAYWWAIDSHSGTSRSTPTFSAHKGSATCLVSTDNDPSHFSMPYQNAPPPFAIANTDVEAWVQKAEKVCLDFYAAVGL